MSGICPKCGGRTERGYADAAGLVGHHAAALPFRFVVNGQPTATNIIEAFKQGLADAPDGKAYVLEGWRCSSCGAVELFAKEPTQR